MSIELLGWLGAVCFALCPIPQAYRSWRQKHSRGISWGFLALWLSGEVLTLLYVAPKRHLPLLANYAANLALLLVIIYHKAFPRDVVNRFKSRH